MINDVVKDGLCTGCGTCVAVCPYDAIKMVINHGIFVPSINDSLCKHCKRCTLSCPGQMVDYVKLNESVYNRQPIDPAVGIIQECYVGYSIDEDVRYTAASGGAITKLLVYALDQGYIDGALVTIMDETDPFCPRPFIARTKEEIIKASRSKYCPVPLNIALKELVKTKSDERIAVVGLPCHIQGLRLAESKKFFKCNLLYLGLFCNHTPSFYATEWWLHKNGIKSEDVKNIEYRGRGWPGSMMIQLKDGTEKYYDYGYWGQGFGRYFYPRRCTLCYDALSVFADISFGDAWLPEYMHDHKGTSIIVVRTSVGVELLRKNGSGLSLTKTSVSKLLESQKGLLKYKTGGYWGRSDLIKLSRRRTPEYNLDRKGVPISGYFGAIVFYISQIPSQHRLWPLLDARCTLFEHIKFGYRKLKSLKK